MAKDKDTYSAWHDWVWRDEIEKGIRRGSAARSKRVFSSSIQIHAVPRPLKRFPAFWRPSETNTSTAARPSKP